MATLQQLDALADAIPVMNQKAAQKAKAARTVQLQSQLGSAQLAPGQTSVRAAQATAPTVVQGNAAIDQAATQQTQQQLGEVANVGLAAKGAEAEASLARQQNTVQTSINAEENAQKLQLSRADMTMRKRVTANEQVSAQRLQKIGIEVDNKLQIATLRQREQLNRLGGDVKDKILDSRLRFERDDMGRKFSNERQLADYAIANAKTEIEFRSHLQDVQQASERKIQLLEITQRSLLNGLENEWSYSERMLDNANRARIAQMAADMREEIEREKAKSQGRMQMWQTGGTIVGAVVGGVAAGYVTGGMGAAQGAAVGASIGGAAGTLVGGYVEGQRE